MSGNPYENPFEDNVDVNPFRSPAVGAPVVAAAPVVQAPRAQPPPVVEEGFNPFNQQPPKGSPPQAVVGPPRLPSAIATGPVDGREAALLKRIQELEESQARQQAELRTRQGFEPPKNWPPCYPLVRHAIDEDITEPNAHRLVKIGYLLWILHSCALVVNMIGCLADLVSPSTATDATVGTNFGIAVVFLVLLIPLGFIFWYRQLYDGAANDKAASFLIFLCMFAINIIFIIVMIIGIPAGGSTGFINMIQAFAMGKVPAGVIMVISMAAWGGDLALSIWLMIRVYLHFRGRGGTDRLKAEAVAGAGNVIRNNPQVAASIVSAAASGAAGASQQV